MELVERVRSDDAMRLGGIAWPEPLGLQELGDLFEEQSIMGMALHVETEGRSHQSVQLFHAHRHASRSPPIRVSRRARPRRSCSPKSSRRTASRANTCTSVFTACRGTYCAAWISAWIASRTTPAPRCTSRCTWASRSSRWRADPVWADGSSILTNLGHTEWIASTEEEYVEKAVALASGLPRLATLRAGLRHRMQSSQLMDAAGFTRRVEAAYRAMFERWAKT
jgi:hypothetical protein